MAMSVDDAAARRASCSGATPRVPLHRRCPRRAGRPVVIRNAPLLDDGTPMPTRYWLVGAAAVRAVSRLESGGGVARAERAVDPDEVADAHRRYAAERDAELPSTTPARCRPEVSAGPVPASSASTPTTRGSSPAATTRSVAGSPNGWRDGETP